MIYTNKKGKVKFELRLPNKLYWDDDSLKKCAGSSRLSLLPQPTAAPPTPPAPPARISPSSSPPWFSELSKWGRPTPPPPLMGGTTSRPNHPPEPQPPKLPRWGYLLSLHMSTICVIWELCMLTVQRVSARDSSKPGWRCPLRDTDWVIDRIEETWPFSLTNPKNSNSKDRRSF